MPNLRTGKIARLPFQIRTQLNRRLQNGSSLPRLAAWLNALPEVRATMKEYFHSRPILRQNLSEWRQGGYQDWLQDQSPEDLSHCLTETATAFTNSHPPVTDALSHWSATRLALRTRRINALQEKDPEAADKLLTKLIRDLTTLQQSQTRARRAQCQRDHLTFRETQAREKAEALREQTDADHEAWALHPDNQDRLWQSLCTAYPDDYHNIPDEDDSEDEPEENQDDQPRNHRDQQPRNYRDDQSEEDSDDDSDDDDEDRSAESDEERPKGPAQAVPSACHQVTPSPTHPPESSATRSHSSHPERSAGGQAGVAQSKDPEPSSSPSAQATPSPCHQVTPSPSHPPESPDAQAYIAARLAAMDADLRIIRARIIDPTPYTPPTPTEIRIQRIHNGQNPDTGEIPPNVRRPIPIPKHLPYPKTEKEAYFQRLRIDPDYPFPEC